MRGLARWLRWIGLLPLRQQPPLPARVPPPPRPDPDWGPVWVVNVARRLAAELGHGEEPQDITMTVLGRDGVYTGLLIRPGDQWPHRSVLVADEQGDLRAVDVPDTVAGAEREDPWE